MITPRIVDTMMPAPATRRVLTMPTQSARPIVSARSGVSAVWMPSEIWILDGLPNQS